MAEPPKLRIIPGPTRVQRALEILSNAPYNWGTWENVLTHRAWMLAHDYPHPDIPETDLEGRMDRLKADLTDAIRDQSIIRAKEFPFDAVADLSTRIGLANVVDDFVDGEGELSELADKNRERHFRTLVDALMRAAVVTHRERVEMWLHDHDRATPNNTDLTWLAVAEMNADLIGAAPPRVLVLPNFHHAYNPFFVRVDASVEVDAWTAECLRLLFSR